MKTYLLSIALASTALISSAQVPNLSWQKAIGKSYLTSPTGIATDSKGNVYTFGAFADTVDFDPGVGVFNMVSKVGTNGIKEDAYVTKLDSLGNFVWAKRFGANLEDNALHIKIDANDNLYVSGIFHETVDFDPNAGVFNLTTVNVNDGAGFLLKLTSAGNFVWAIINGEDVNTNILTSRSTVSDIWLDSDANLYSVGRFFGTTDFDGSTATHNLVSPNNHYIESFITKIDSLGNFIWAKQYGGKKIDAATAITCDNAGNVFITGTYNDTADFNPDSNAVFNIWPVPNTGLNTTQDVYILKLTSAGNFV
jgi:hypothetical protein